MEEYPQSLSGLTATTQNLFELIKGQGIIVYPDAEIRTAVSHAVALESTRGWRLTKAATSHKIDVVVALSLACLAAVRKGEVPPTRIGFTGPGGGRVYYPDLKPEPTDVHYVLINEAGEEISAEQAQALRHTLPGGLGRHDNQHRRHRKLSRRRHRLCGAWRRSLRPIFDRGEAN